MNSNTKQTISPKQMRLYIFQILLLLLFFTIFAIFFCIKSKFYIYIGKLY